MSEHAGNCGYVLHGRACDCGLWEQSAVMFKHQERIRELEDENYRLNMEMAAYRQVHHMTTFDGRAEHER